MVSSLAAGLGSMSRQEVERRKRLWSESTTSSLPDSSSSEEEEVERSSVLGCFVHKCRQLRAMPERLVTEVAVLSAVAREANKEGIACRQLAWTADSVWHAVHLEMAAVSEIRRLYRTIQGGRICADVNRVLGRPHRRKASRKGGDLVELLRAKDGVWKEFCEKKGEGALDKMRESGVAFHASWRLLEIDAYNLEALCRVKDFRTWAKESYADDPHDFCARMGGTEATIKRLIAHLKMSRRHCVTKSSKALILVGGSGKRERTTPVQYRIEGALSRAGFVFVPVRSSSKDDVCAEAACLGVPIFCTRQQEGPKIHHRFLRVPPVEMWALAGREIFLPQDRLRDCDALNSTASSAIEGVLSEVLPMSLRETLVSMKGVMVLRDTPADFEYDTLRAALWDEGLALMVCSAEIEALMEAILPAGLLIHEVGYRTWGGHLRGVPVREIEESLRSCEAPPLTIVSPYPSRTAHEHGLAQLPSPPATGEFATYDATSEGKARISTPDCAHAKQSFEEGLLRNVKAARTNSRVDAQSMGLFREALLRDTDDVALCFVHSEQEHPMTHSKFPRACMFKVPCVSPTLEEYLCGHALLRAALAPRMQQGLTLRLWLIGRELAPFARISCVGVTIVAKAEGGEEEERSEEE